MWLWQQRDLRLGAECFVPPELMAPPRCDGAARRVLGGDEYQHWGRGRHSDGMAMHGGRLRVETRLYRLAGSTCDAWLDLDLNRTDFVPRRSWCATAASGGRIAICFCVVL